MHLLLRLLVFTMLMLAHGVYANTFKYVSPVPGSKLVTQESNIILLEGDLIDSHNLHSGLIVVTGSVSGVHSGRFFLSDDDRTLIFQPDWQFSVAENVSVNYLGGIRTLSGRVLEPFSFEFTVSPTGRSEFGRSSLYENLGLTDETIPRPVRQTVTPPTFLRDTLPEGFPLINVSINNVPPGDGKLFLSNMTLGGPVQNTPFLFTLNSNAALTFAERKNEICLDFKRQPNGLLTYFDSALRGFFALDSNYRVVDEIRCGNGYVTDVHDLHLLPNGHALVLGEDRQVVNMSEIVPGGNPNAVVTGLIVQELDRSRNVVFQWRSWDHFLITDASNVSLTAATIDYVHVNAVELDVDGNLLISNRHMDEITKIDRLTGNIIWRLGGENNQFTFVNDSLRFSFQHAIRRLPNGNVILFDNGNFRSPQFSRVVEYQLDERRRTATLVWQYRNTPDVYSFAMGYAQRLENGNTLIGWGSSSSPAVTEVGPDGSKVFEMSFPAGIASYRAYRFDWEPGGTTSVAHLDAPLVFSLVQNYPNPFNPSTVIRFVLPTPTRTTLKVYNVLGQEVATLLNEFKDAGMHSVVFDAKTLASGVYYYTLNAGQQHQTKKMLLMK